VPNPEKPSRIDRETALRREFDHLGGTLIVGRDGHVVCESLPILA
jgi:hypothetical protein